MDSEEEARLNKMGTFIRALRTISLVASDIKDCTLKIKSVVVVPLRLYVYYKAPLWQHMWDDLRGCLHRNVSYSLAGHMAAGRTITISQELQADDIVFRRIELDLVLRLERHDDESCCQYSWFNLSILTACI